MINIRLCSLFTTRSSFQPLGWFVNYGYSYCSDVKFVPSAPKKPLSSYILFVQENRMKLLQTQPDLKLTEQTRVLAAEWRQLDPAIKQIYIDRFKKTMAEYQSAVKKYQQSLTEEQKQHLADISQKLRAKRNMQRLKAALRELKKPPGMRNAFSFFLASRMPQRGNLPLADYTRRLSFEWKNIPEESKKEFLKKADEDKKRYEVEMTDWKKQIIKGGHSEILEAFKKAKAEISKTKLK